LYCLESASMCKVRFHQLSSASTVIMYVLTREMPSFSLLSEESRKSLILGQNQVLLNIRIVIVKFLSEKKLKKADLTGKQKSVSSSRII